MAKGMEVEIAIRNHDIPHQFPPAVEKAVKKYLVSSIEEHTKITFAENQNDAGMLGAFYHFCGVHLKA